MNLRNKPCICKSRKKAKHCCLNANGVWVKPPLQIDLARSKSEIAKDGCYLSSLNCCSDKLSREHYVTEAVLDAVGEKIAIGGAAWMKKNESRVIGKGSLTAHVLCTEHNSLLAGLDYEAAKFFAAVRASDFSKDGAGDLEIFCGYDLERWLLKTAMGMLQAKVLGDGKDGPITQGLDQSLDVTQMLEKPESWPEGAGLYFLPSVGSVITRYDEFVIEPITRMHSGELVGLNVSIQGLHFYISFTGTKDKESFLQRAVYRPEKLLFQFPQKPNNTLLLSWGPSNDNQILKFQFKGAITEEDDVPRKRVANLGI